MVLPDDQLKKLLLQASVVDEKKLAELLEFTKNSRVSLQEAVIEKDILEDEQLGLLIANSLKYPFVSLSKITIPDPVFNIIPERIARKYKVIPFERDSEGIKLAMAEPSNAEIQVLIAKKAGARVTAYLATERDIENALLLYRKDLQRTFDELLEAEIASSTNLAIPADEAPIAKIVDLLITYAYRDKASDLHIEPEEKGGSLIRFRIDGIMHDVLLVSKTIHERIVTRIKVLSRLRTDEHLSAQDGKMRVLVDDENLELRVSIVPVADGEKAVLRLLSSHYRQFSLIDLGMNESDLKKVTHAINRSYGMILSTGPTGSGKTTSIYAILKILNTREKNITTIEDPVEYRIKGVNQIQVNVKTSLTFANALRSILSQDPNIVFVGEIRDSETASIAVNAALTGHLVLSTIHTNDAATALPRLIDMEVEPFLVASTVSVIVAQRLVRKICDGCKTSTIIKKDIALKNISEQIISKYFGDKEEIKVFTGKGCKICHFTGYSGRIGVFEVIEVSEIIRKLITEKSDSDVIAKEAIREGMTPIFEDGIEKASKGLTSIEEVIRVTKVESL